MASLRPRLRTRPLRNAPPADTPQGITGTLIRRIFSIDLRTLAAFRICFALALLVDLYDRALSLEAHYTDVGTFPIQVMKLWIGPNAPWWSGFSIHGLGGGLAYQIFLWVLAVLFAFSLLVGYQSRIAALLSWVMLVSVHNRNPMVLHGGDVMLRCMAFWATWLPLGVRWSVDGLLTSR
jgi:hypothetical protein